MFNFFHEFIPTQNTVRRTFIRRGTASNLQTRFVVLFDADA